MLCNAKYAKSVASRHEIVRRTRVLPVGLSRTHRWACGSSQEPTAVVLLHRTSSNCNRTLRASRVLQTRSQPKMGNKNPLDCSSFLGSNIRTPTAVFLPIPIKIHRQSPLPAPKSRAPPGRNMCYHNMPQHPAVIATTPVTNRNLPTTVITPTPAAADNHPTAVRTPPPGTSNKIILHTVATSTPATKKTLHPP